MNIDHQGVEVFPTSAADKQRQIVENAVYFGVGQYFIDKYRALAARVGTQQVARNLKKQGVSLEIALAILAR